jgi:hypothetical protein
MSNSGAPSRHRRKPGNDDADMHSRDALCIRVFLHAFQESLPRTDGRPSLSGGQVFREAKSLLPMSLLPKEGGGAPNGAPRLPRLDAQARPRPDKRGRSPFGAPPRSCAGIHSRLGLGRASWNHQMQTGGPSPAPVQRAPRSPVTRRTGRCPNRLKAKSDELRPQEPHPLRQSASPVDVPYDERDGRCYPNPQPRCQRPFDLCRQIAGLRGAIAAPQKPGRVSLHAKDSQKRSCACQSRLSVLCESFRSCAASTELHSSP